MIDQEITTRYDEPGSSLLYVDQVPLGLGESRESEVIKTVYASILGIDIHADKNCTVTIVRLPDGKTAGEQSVAAQVEAGYPIFLQYSHLLCPAVKVVVTNVGAEAMTSFALYVRGGA